MAIIATPRSGTAALAAKAATTKIPIVFSTEGDPVQTGLVTSLNRSGGNITGVSYMNAELGAKRLGLLHELLPKAARFAVLVNPSNAPAAEAIKDLQSAAAALGLPIEVLTATNSRERAAGLDPPRLTVTATSIILRNELLATERFLTVVVSFPLVLLRKTERRPVRCYPRRALQVPEQGPFGPCPRHVPFPELPDNRPEPDMWVVPNETVALTAPLGATRPEKFNGPAAAYTITPRDMLPEMR